MAGNKFKQILEQDPIFPSILSASVWNENALRKKQYVSKSVLNSSDGAFLPQFEAKQVKLAYHYPDRKSLIDYYDKSVIGVYWGKPQNALFYLGLIGKGYLTIVADGVTSASDLISAGKRIQKKL
ncbi:MAG: hypothetical protein V1731_02695 [Candidatus Aenigmatarchaeota archaeon]